MTIKLLYYKEHLHLRDDTNKAMLIKSFHLSKYNRRHKWF